MPRQVFRDLSSRSNSQRTTPVRRSSSNTTSIPPMNDLHTKLTRMSSDTDLILNLSKEIHRRIDQMNTQQYIRNRQTGSTIYRAQEREQFWSTPYGMNNYQSWKVRLMYIKNFLNSVNHIGIENCVPSLLYAFLRLNIPVLRYMKTKCNQFSTQNT